MTREGAPQSSSGLKRGNSDEPLVLAIATKVLTALNESCGSGSIPEPDFTDEIEPGMTSLGMYWHDGGNGLHMQIDRDGVGWSWFDRPAQCVRIVQSAFDAPPPLEFVRAMRRNCERGVGRST